MVLRRPAAQERGLRFDPISATDRASSFEGTTATAVAPSSPGAGPHPDHEPTASGCVEPRLALQKRLWRERGRQQLESFPLAPWASRRRRYLLELMDRLNPTRFHRPLCQKKACRTHLIWYLQSSRYAVGTRLMRPISPIAFRKWCRGEPDEFSHQPAGFLLDDFCGTYAQRAGVRPL